MTKHPNSAALATLAMPRRAVFILLAALFVANPMQALAQAKAETERSFGFWQIKCEKPPGARTKRCALLQHVIDEERSNVGLRVLFWLTSKGERVLFVVTPLGVLLPFGLGLRIDKEVIGDKPLPFIRCRQTGCISEIIVKDALLDKLKTGTEALFIIAVTKEEGRAIPISLKGFAKGFEHLTALSKAK